jgi:hypothetical protein
VIEAFDHEVARVDQKLGEHGRRLARVEDATVIAELNRTGFAGGQ